MKRILSLILVVCMLLTLAPVQIFAQTVVASFTFGNATYQAGVGETISIPVVVEATAGMKINSLYAEIIIPDGVDVIPVSGIVDVSYDATNVYVGDGMIIAMPTSAFTVPDNGVATLFTLECISNQAGGYSFSYDNLELYDSDDNPFGDGTLASKGTTLTFGASKATFESVSTLVKSQNFDGGDFTAGEKVTATEVDGVTGIATQDSFYSSTEQVEEGNLAFYMERDMAKYGDSTWWSTARWHADAVTNTPYMVVSYRSKSNSENDHHEMRFYYDNLTNGELVPDSDVGTYKDSSDKPGLPMYFKYDRIERDGPENGQGEHGCDNKVYFTANKYLGTWHEYTYLIDTINKKAYLYIDGAYFMSFKIINNRDASSKDENKFIEGVEYIQFAQARYSSASDGTVKKTYIDDLQVRSMSNEQFAKLISDDIDFEYEVIKNEDVLPVKSQTYKYDITWTTDNGAVKVDEEGVVSAGAAANNKTVTFIATVNGVQVATYTVKVSVPTNIDIILYEPFDYTADQPISQADAAANGWSIQNESATSGKGNNPYVKADPADSNNKVLDIEVLTTKDTSKNKYSELKGTFNANGKKYIEVSTKIRTSAYANTLSVVLQMLKQENKQALLLHCFSSSMTLAVKSSVTSKMSDMTNRHL